MGVSGSSTIVGERRGVASGSVRRINWIATSSSEITLAEVGVGVGRSCVEKVLSGGDVRVGFDTGGRSGRFWNQQIVGCLGVLGRRILRVVALKS